MPLYQYKAIDAEARKVSGIVEAQNENEAKSKLRERGLMVSTINTKIRISRRDNIDRESLLTLTHQLAQLVNAGVPLYQGLLTLEEQYETERYHRILLSLCDQVKAGLPLSEAMKAYPDSFDTLYTSMIAAGEASGSLGLVLERLSELLSKQLKLKKEIQTAMIYPSILALFSLLVIGLLLGFVVPSIEGIFEGRELNTFTNMVLALSRFARGWFWVYTPLIFLSIIGIWAYIRTPRGRLKVETLLLKLPLVKKLIVQAAVSRFCRTLSTLLEGGVPLLDALKMSQGVMANRTLEEEVEEASDQVIQGKALSQGLKQSAFFPPLVSRMVAIGEDSGKLSGMLTSIASMYEETLEKSLSQLVALAQPVILIVMGGVIGLVMVAILLPMSDIASLTQQ